MSIFEDSLAVASAYVDEQVSLAVADAQVPFIERIRVLENNVDSLTRELETARSNVSAANDHIQAITAERDAARKELADHMATHQPATPAEIREFVDFTSQSSGLYTRGNLTGAGVDKTTYRMKSRSSTKTAPTSGTNQLHLIRAGGGLNQSVQLNGADVGGFTLEGTDQGHLYNGLMVPWSTGVRVHDIKITGIPGNSSAPPGETFSLNLWHANQSKVERVVVDAKNTSGQAVGASLIGLNDCYTSEVTNVAATGTTYGFGIAIWQCSDVTVRDADFSKNRRAINTEQMRSGTFRYINCNMSGQTSGGPHIVFATALQSCKLEVIDPILGANEWPLRIGVPRVGANYEAGGNRPHVQRVEDVKVIIGGVDVTADKSKVLVGQVPGW